MLICSHGISHHHPSNFSFRNCNVCIYIYMYTYIYTHIIYIVHIFVEIFWEGYVYVYIYIHTYIIYTYDMSMYMYMYMYIYIYSSINISSIVPGTFISSELGLLPQVLGARQSAWALPRWGCYMGMGQDLLLVEHPLDLVWKNIIIWGYIITILLYWPYYYWLS